jgi:Ca2+-binding EF-hand superfamily protein
MEEAPMPEAPMGEEGGEEELNQLLAQLSPEEIEQLAQELAAEMGGESAGSNELEQVPELAAAIEQQLGQNPEVAEATAPSPEMTEEVMAKQSAINFIKSAEYVEGFLEQAIGRGMNLKQAVELYDSAFSTTFNQLKTSELKGNQHKLDVDGDGKIEADDLKKLRAGKAEVKEAELKGDQHKLDVDGDGKIEADDLKKLRAGKKNEVDEKTAAYYEGVLERCREYGMTDVQALELVKNAKAAKSLFEGAKDIGRKAVNYVAERPARAAAIGTGVTAAGLVGYNALKKEDKEDKE